MNMEYDENKVLIQRHTVYSFDFPIISRVRCGFYSKAASIFIFDAFDAASNRGRLIFKGRLLFKEIRYLVHQCFANQCFANATVE